MTNAWLLQSWTRVAGPVGGSLTQSECGWLDLAEATDVEIVTSIKEITGNPELKYETSPSRDEDLFSGMVPLSMGVGRSVTVVRFATAAEPLARWVRWRVLDQGGLAFALTFRTWIRCVRTSPINRPMLDPAVRATTLRERRARALRAPVAASWNRALVGNESPAESLPPRDEAQALAPPGRSPGRPLDETDSLAWRANVRRRVIGEG
jgi:hypothetical protein